MVDESLAHDIENLRDLVRSGGWEVFKGMVAAEGKLAMTGLLEADEGTESARLKARIAALSWALSLPQSKIAEYDANEAQALEDDPQADNPRERLSPIPEGNEHG